MPQTNDPAEVEPNVTAEVEPSRCSACGNIKGSWENNSTKLLTSDGSKARQRNDIEDRAADYRKWHRELGQGIYVMDIDQFEYRIVDDGIVPVAILELTRFDDGVNLNKRYFESILNRFNKRDVQGRLITYIAEKLSCHAWIVLFKYDLSEFHLFNLTENRGRGWYHDISAERYADWITEHNCGMNINE